MKTAIQSKLIMRMLLRLHKCISLIFQLALAKLLLLASFSSYYISESRRNIAVINAHIKPLKLRC